MSEKEENIQVSVRVRPLNGREKKANEKSGWRVVDGVSIVSNEHNGRSGQNFSFGGSPFPQPGKPRRGDVANMDVLHGGRPCFRRDLDAGGRVQGLRIQHHRVRPQRAERSPSNPVQPL